MDDQVQHLLDFGFKDTGFLLMMFSGTLISAASAKSNPARNMKYSSIKSELTAPAR